MSANAVRNLKQIWEKLAFSRVKRVIAREPEDVLRIDICKVFTTSDGVTMLSNNPEYQVESRRTKDIPSEDRQRANVSWRHYYGFTYDSTYFRQDDYCELDFDIDFTLDFSRWANHRGGWAKPKPGQLIAGHVVGGQKGKRFQKWFVCPPELEFLIRIVRIGSTLARDDQLAASLLTSGFPDKYWAAARLLFFDNVAAFVNRPESQLPLHPCFGKEYPCGLAIGKNMPRVDWRGMYLPKTNDVFVHHLSYYLGEQKWWKEYLVLDPAMALNHPGSGGCKACDAARKNEMWATIWS